MSQGGLGLASAGECAMNRASGSFSFDFHMSLETPPSAASATATRPPGLPFFKAGWMKKAINLSKGVRKFTQYNEDLMVPEKLDKVRALHARYDLALRNRNREETDALEKELIASCEGAVPGYKSSPVKENIEVIVVAIVVALGIRAYFLQPFKIPTASMQPTLNGITAEAVPAGKDFPNYLVRGLEYVGRGRNYVEIKVPGDWGTVKLVGIRQRSMLHFFTVTDLIFEDAVRREKVLTGYVPSRQLWESLWTGQRPAISPADQSAVLGGMEKFTARVQSGPIQAGTVIARGYIDTGDQVLVNKMVYHFRRPERGEVFVFSTSGIKGIRPPVGIDSQHYIKRLTALPNDRVQLQPVVNEGDPGWQDGRAANLYINGQPAVEPGMQRVMSRQNKYPGYTLMDGPPRDPTGFAGKEGISKYFMSGTESITLNNKQYLAMGDNSPFSSDSRVWGPVPEQNLVGPALFVYWPFLPHFGLIR